MQSNAPFVKCKDAVKRGLLQPGEHCPKCPKKSGDCLFKSGLWRPLSVSSEGRDSCQTAASIPDEPTHQEQDSDHTEARTRAEPHRFGVNEHVEQLAPSKQDRRLSAQRSAEQMRAASTSEVTGTAPPRAEAIRTVGAFRVCEAKLIPSEVSKTSILFFLGVNTQTKHMYVVINGLCTVYLATPEG